ncbi:MAG: twin-arginine translocase TatA/TatE family subunit [Pseudomonadota bacterium]|nr:MAG: twin-arginine translocase TatA/TatE family subunit [Pseudomonadota bacterium]
MGISIWQLLIILVIVLLLFGAKRLRNIGTDLGEAVKGFRKSVKDPGAEGEAGESTEKLEQDEGTVIEGEATKEKDKA